MPSISLSRPMNRPNSVMFLTSPSTSVPFGMGLGKDLPRVAHGLLEAQRHAALGGVDLQHHDLDLLEVETILPGWTFFLVQDISETWTSPSMPGSSSTKAP
jgi:hypothetical protein